MKRVKLSYKESLSLNAIRQTSKKFRSKMKYLNKNAPNRKDYLTSIKMSLKRLALHRQDTQKARSTRTILVLLTHNPCELMSKLIKLKKSSQFKNPILKITSIT